VSEEQISRNKMIFRISLWVFILNALIALIKLAGGFLFRSLSMLGDGIDSLGDVLATASVLVAAKWLQKPPDKDHPWGHDRADTLASKFINFFMFFMGTQLLIRSVETLLRFEPNQPPDNMGIIVISLSIALKLGMAISLKKEGQNQESAMLKTNAQNMANDVVLSASVLIGIIASQFFQTNFIDVVTACLVSFWIIYHSIQGFNKTNLELMDGLKEPELYQKVFNAVESVNGAFNPHRVRIRRFADRYLIDLDVEMNGKISLEEAHRLGCVVECEIKKALPQVYDIMLHLEPKGNQENERYGLSRSKL
jgi:cation diffusion facilitator family transporter